jgi:ribose transport system ATP-binding protein
MSNLAVTDAHHPATDGQSPLPVLEAVGISKSFPGVRALDDVCFDIVQGEVHALCGENGAGKSTLLKILAGTFPPDAGEIRHKGEPIRLESPLDAKRRGILLVHQEISLVRELTVAENIFLGSLPTNGWGRVRRRTLFDQATRVLKASGGDFDDIRATDIVGKLSIARQQMVEIARASALNPSVVIFDEPTASLTAAETAALFRTIRRMRREGIAIVYISHKMSEIFELSDRITVLRDGRIRGTLVTAETDEDEVTRLMVGRSLEGGFRRPAPVKGPERLRIENFSVPGRVSGVDLSVREGEIVGLYGLIGAGRSELVEALCGLRARTGGSVCIDGEVVDIRTPRQALKRGLALVPEDRKQQGLILGLGVAHNVCLPIMDDLARYGWNDHRRERAIYNEFKDMLSIKAASPSTLAGTLSGGNQQKIVLAKWLATRPKLLILDEPTRGIDVGAKAEIYMLIARLAEAGMAILLISSEMPEILGLSHRILAMHEGRIVAEFEGSKASEEDVLGAIMKLKDKSGAQMRDG